MRLLYLHFLFLALLPFCYCDSSYSKPDDTSPVTFTSLTNTEFHGQRCDIEGNSDLYGLGIRLGVYLQLISTLLTNHLLPEALGEAWDANTIFLVAILIAILKSSAQNGAFTSPEAFVMVQLMLAFLLAVFHISNRAWAFFEIVSRILSGTWQVDAKMQDLYSDLGFVRRNISPLGITLRSILALAIASYNVWFWFGGSDALDSGLHCSPMVFLFASVDVHGKARYFFMVFSILYLVYRTIRFAWSVFPIPQVIILLISILHSKRTEPYSVISRAVRGRVLLKALGTQFRLGVFSPKSPFDRHAMHGQDRGNSQKSSARKYDRRSRRREHMVRFWHGTTFSCSAVVIIWSVVAIELTLVWNGIHNIYNISSTGQLIPFVVGIAGAIRTIVQLTVKQLEDRDEGVRTQSKQLGEKSAWRYRVPYGRTIEFGATPQVHRWSFDDLAEASVITPRLPFSAEDDRMAPPSPDKDLQSDASDPAGSGNTESRWIRVCWNKSRWIYRSNGGKYHVFHERGSPQRRRSFDDRRELVWQEDFCRPHPARAMAAVPLSQRFEVQHELRERKVIEKERGRRKERRQNVQGDVSLDSSARQPVATAGDGSRGQENLPGGMGESLPALHDADETQGDHLRSNVRRWSFTDGDRSDARMLKRKLSWSSRNRLGSRHGSEYNHFSRRSRSSFPSQCSSTGSANDSISHSNGRNWKFRLARFAARCVLFMFNSLFCCAPCVLAIAGVTRWTRARRRRPKSRRGNQGQAQSGVQHFIGEICDPRTDCSKCDVDFTASALYLDTSASSSSSVYRRGKKNWRSWRSIYSWRYSVGFVIAQFATLWGLTKHGAVGTFGRSIWAKVVAVFKYDIMPSLATAEEDDQLWNTRAEAVREVQVGQKRLTAQRRYKRPGVKDVEKGEDESQDTEDSTAAAGNANAMSPEEQRKVRSGRAIKQLTRQLQTR